MDHTDPTMRLAALDRAINFHCGRDTTPEQVLETAHKFEKYLDARVDA